LDGAAAGLVATLGMSLVMLGAKRLGALGEPPPRRLLRKLLPLLSLAPRKLNATALVSHFGFGATMGTLFALLPVERRTTLGGAAFGLAVWGGNYAGWLPKAGLMPRPTQDRLGRPTSMIVAHLVFGATLAAVYRRRRGLTELPLRGKVALIGGGSRGLGRALARELLEQGASVAICARGRQALEETRAWLEPFAERSGGRVLAEICDLRSEVQTLQLFERVARELGPVDVAVANAATLLVAPIETLTPNDFDDAMRDIFGTAMRVALTALPAMRARRRGTIVLITSIGARIGVPHLVPYSAAKFAEAGFAEGLRAEVAKDGVQVLAVFPGLMRTGSHAHATFRGQATKELEWFGAGAVMPLLSIDADRAARQIVEAIRDGASRLTLTPAARLAIGVHDVLPGLWALMSAMAGRLMPDPPNAARAEEREGLELLSRPDSRTLRAIAGRTASLAERHGQ